MIDILHGIPRAAQEKPVAEGQQLNSLDRFRKEPGRLVLEQHSHCEVPAGCGGVVLRWRNPHAAFPLTLYHYTPGRLRLSLDEAEVTTGRFDVAPGRHVLNVTLDEVDLSAELLLLALVHEPNRPQRESGDLVVEQPFKLVTAYDDTWLFSLDPSADECDWLPLVCAATPTLNDRDQGFYRIRRCTEAGAICLALPVRPVEPKLATVHIRKHFSISIPEVRPE